MFYALFNKDAEDKKEYNSRQLSVSKNEKEACTYITAYIYLGTIWHQKNKTWYRSNTCKYVHPRLWGSGPIQACVYVSLSRSVISSSMAVLCKCVPACCFKMLPTFFRQFFTAIFFSLPHNADRAQLRSLLSIRFY